MEYTDDQLRDLLELWERNSQGLSESHMNALVASDQTPEETRAKIVAMITARQTGVRPQRVSATEETYLREHGLTELEPPKSSRKRKLFGRSHS